jgi:hypothetical protein
MSNRATIKTEEYSLALADSGNMTGMNNNDIPQWSQNRRRVIHQQQQSNGRLPALLGILNLDCILIMDKVDLDHRSPDRRLALVYHLGRLFKVSYAPARDLCYDFYLDLFRENQEAEKVEGNIYTWWGGRTSGESRWTRILGSSL